jgi:DNA-directed RNA polymerase sigma subunit (sigma70/sigma32)
VQLGREPTLDECAVAAEIRPEELRQRYVVGRHSKQQMMDCNLRLVVSISRKYAMRGVPLEDLVAEGTFLLLSVSIHTMLSRPSIMSALFMHSSVSS